MAAERLQWLGGGVANRAWCPSAHHDCIKCQWHNHHEISSLKLGSFWSVWGEVKCLGASYIQEYLGGRTVSGDGGIAGAEDMRVEDSWQVGEKQDLSGAERKGDKSSGWGFFPHRHNNIKILIIRCAAKNNRGINKIVLAFESGGRSYWCNTGK